MSVTSSENDRRHDEQPIVISAQSARAGVISGRVILVLAISLLLAGIAMIAVLGYFWSSPTVPH